MVSALKFRAKALAPVQISNRCGSLFVITPSDIHNGRHQLQQGISLVFDASKPFRTGKLSCFLNPDTNELAIHRYKPDGYVYSGGLIAAVQQNGR